jgi:hypothetical protein
MAVDALSGKTTPACWSRSSSIGTSSPANENIGEETRIWTRSALRAELLRVLGILDNVNRDVSAAVANKKVSPAEWEQWRQGYLTGHQFLTSASPSWGSNVEPAHEWEQYAVKWRDFVEARGGKTSGPRTERKPETSMATIAVYGGLAAGGALALGYLINSVRK